MVLTCVFWFKILNFSGMEHSRPFEKTRILKFKNIIESVG